MHSNKAFGKYYLVLGILAKRTNLVVVLVGTVCLRQMENSGLQNG